MASSGMLRRVALVRTDVSEERNASIIRVRRICELGILVFLRSVRRLLLTANVVPSSSILVTLMMEVLGSSETRFLQEPCDVIFQKTPFFNTFKYHARKGQFLPDPSGGVVK
jgi:hypothetical protein